MYVKSVPARADPGKTRHSRLSKPIEQAIFASDFGMLRFSLNNVVFKDHPADYGATAGWLASPHSHPRFTLLLYSILFSA